MEVIGQRMASRSSESSGDGDEFFDAVDHFDDEPDSCENDRTAESGEYCRLQSLGESTLEEEENDDSQSPDPGAPPPRTLQLQETDELWASAQSFPNRTTSLLDAVPSDSASYDENDEKHGGADNMGGSSVENVEKEIDRHDEANNDSDEGGPDDIIIGSTDDMDNNNTSIGENDVNDVNLGNNDRLDVVGSTDDETENNMKTNDNNDDAIYTVETKEMEEIIERQYNESDSATLTRLVDKLHAAELSRLPQKNDEEEKTPAEEENQIGDAASNDGQAIIAQNESVEEDSPSKYVTPYKIDCSNVGDLVHCDITSPLEALYLFCSGSSSLNIKGERGDGHSSQPIVTRTSVTNDADMGELPPPPPSDDDENDNSNLNSDSSDDDSSSASCKYQMIDKDTGRVYDLRDVMKEIEEGGSSDALDTRYSFLPTKDQLELQRQSTYHEVDSKDSDAPTIPSAAASVDSDITDTSPKIGDRKRGVTFSKIATSKMAANVRKGVAGIKSSRKQKMNRKRTASADMIPCNALYVRSKQKQSRSLSSSGIYSEHSQDIQADSSFNPMLLIKTLPNAHKGPAWCASFSLNGRFLATAGENDVCIWAIAPNSKTMHPDGVKHQKEKKSENKELLEGSPQEENPDNASEDEDPNPLHFMGMGPDLGTNLEIISSDPIARYNDHTADVIDLSWSHTNFLLTASLDSSVRLYHFSKPGCLHLFKHPNLVASVAFHPSDDRYFISGGIDKKLRLWDITDGRVKEWAQSPDVITATRFTPDGKYAVAGLFRGQVYFYLYDFNGLKYYTQIACRNRKGKQRMGRKVTGISFVRGERDDWLQADGAIPEQGETSALSPTLTERLSGAGKDISRSVNRLSDSGKDMARKMTNAVFRHGSTRAEALRYTERMLVTTNDSRIRLYDLSDFQLVRKYKGHTNSSMQIRARMNESGSHIACGSESGHIYIWETLNKKRSLNKSHGHQTHDKSKSSDHFEASRAPLPIVTDSVFFPSRSVNEALFSSEKLFPFALGMGSIDDDMSNAAILSLDYDGVMRVFLRKSCIDNILDAATPRGGTLA